MWLTYFQLVSYSIRIAYIIPENVAFKDFHIAFNSKSWLQWYFEFNLS